MTEDCLSDQHPRNELTPEQIAYIYERKLGLTELWVVLSGFAAIAAGLALYLLLPAAMWMRVRAAVVAIVVGGGMLQRLLVLRVRCPSCGARVLGRIHSMFQARSIRECPGCGTRLLG
jgi:predicted RNA-binding Zn-ribbon protein involved in translation (DUF1610 family)